jgi:hypothetical protein
MSRVGRAISAIGRAFALMLPAQRREWLQALWSEGFEVPAGPKRLLWRAGGVRIVAGGLLMRRRLWSTLLFAAVVGFIAWEFGPGPASGSGAIDRVDVVSMLVLLGVLASVGSRYLTPAETRIARFLRGGMYIGFLALIPARAAIEQFAYQTPLKTAPAHLYQAIAGPSRAKATGSFFPEIISLILVALYVVAVIWITSRKSRIARTTLVSGTVAGLLLGVVMYVVAPLGLSQEATNPWLPGSDIDPFVVVAWLLVLLGPCTVGGIAYLRYVASNGKPSAAGDGIRQVVAAGLLMNLLGALIVTVFGNGTIALMISASWLRNWLYHGHRLLFGVAGLEPVSRSNPAAIAYSHQITGDSDARALLLLGILFLLVAAIEMAALAGFMWANAQMEREDPRRGDGGEPRPEEDPRGPGGTLRAEESDFDERPDPEVFILRNSRPGARANIECDRVLVGTSHGDP